jgi:DNA mismatch endonuclease (patch repair protein)
MGFRYRLHKKSLPGTPDLVFAKHKKIIFVHGCFFHMHKCRYGAVTPKTNYEFWQTKRQGNVTRDKKNQTALKKLGWKVMLIWECEIKDVERLSNKIKKFLSN